MKRVNRSPFPLFLPISSPFHHFLSISSSFHNSLSISSSFHHSLSISSSFPYSLSISSQIRLGNSVNVVMITTMGIVWRLSEAEYSLSWQLCTTFVHPPALLVILSTSSSSARNTKGRLWWVHRRQALEGSHVWTKGMEVYLSPCLTTKSIPFDGFRISLSRYGG